MDALRIARVEELAGDDWDRAWAGSPSATWFQSRAWADVWSAYTGGRLRPAAKRIVFSDGVSACLPASEQRGRLGGAVALQLSPGGTAGGWLAHGGLGKPHAELLCAWLLARPGVAWRVNPCDPLAIECVSHRDDADDPTWWLPLGEGFDAIHRGFSKGHRAAARRAEREGVRIEPARSDADWDAYLAAYADSVARWGSRARTVYPQRFFAALRSRCGDSSAMRLWVARDAGEVVAGALIFDAPTHQSYWHGAMRREVRPGAVHLLLRTVIENACREGVEAFDLHPSGGLDGVVRFKKGFGARPRPCPLVRTPPRGRLASLVARVSGR